MGWYALAPMGWLWIVGSSKLQVSFANEPYKRDHILQKRPTIVATPCTLLLRLFYTNLRPNQKIL